MRDEKELISCLITTHNRLGDLKRAVNSVVKQSYEKIELIIVNDFSNDGTKEWINNLQLNIPLIVVNNKALLGGNVSRNIGIKRSSGKYVAFLDDDDVWYEDKLSLQYDIFKNNKSVGVVYCGLNRVVDDKSIKKVIPKKEYKGCLKEKIFETIITTTSTLIIEREMLEMVNYFDENLKFWQEYDLLIRLAQITNFDFVNQVLIDLQVNTNDKQRLSNKYNQWEESVEIINTKYSTLIEKLPIKTLHLKQKTYLIDSIYRMKNNGMTKGVIKNTLKLAVLLKNPKWLYLPFYK